MNFIAFSKEFFTFMCYLIMRENDTDINLDKNEYFS